MKQQFEVYTIAMLLIVAAIIWHFTTEAISKYHQFFFPYVCIHTFYFPHFMNMISSYLNEFLVYFYRQLWQVIYISSNHLQDIETNDRDISMYAIFRCVCIECKTWMQIHRISVFQEVKLANWVGFLTKKNRFIWNTCGHGKHMVDPMFSTTDHGL